MKYSGKYIVLEGIVGTGKSTQARLLYESLKNSVRGREIILTKEPGGTEIAGEIRKIVQGYAFQEEMEPLCEAYLYAASRAQSIRKIVKPALERGAIVISDRSFISSLAYQGAARNLGISEVFDINRHAIEDTVPDIVLFLQMDIEKALQRCFDSKGDKFEKLGREFFQKIHEGYLEVSGMPLFRNRWVNIDASRKIIQVADDIRQATDFLHHS